MTRKPGVERALRGFAEAGNGFGDALDGERDRHRIVRSKGDRAGRDHFAPAALLFGELCLRLPTAAPCSLCGRHARAEFRPRRPARE